MSTNPTRPEPVESEHYTLEEILDRFIIHHAEETSEYIHGTGREAITIALREHEEQCERAYASKKVEEAFAGLNAKLFKLVEQDEDGQTNARQSVELFAIHKAIEEVRRETR